MKPYTPLRSFSSSSHRCNEKLTSRPRKADFPRRYIASIHFQHPSLQIEAALLTLTAIDHKLEILLSDPSSKNHILLKLSTVKYETWTFVASDTLLVLSSG